MSHDTPYSESTSPGVRIVVLNDSWDLLRLMQELLTEEGYHVDIMHAAQGAHQRIKEIDPALVILDMVLETPDAGWQYLQLLKLDPRTIDIPVIVCSAANAFLEYHKERLNELDCHILPKPFDLDSLLNMIKIALEEQPNPPANPIPNTL